MGLASSREAVEAELSTKFAWAHTLEFFHKICEGLAGWAGFDDDRNLIVVMIAEPIQSHPTYL
jgi:hypothetical protein